MSDPKSKPDPKYMCSECNKPYIKKGAMTNHKKKVHNMTKSPLKTGFMDLSSYSDNDDEFELEKTMMAEYAKEQDLKETENELELISNMTNTINFNSSVLLSNVEAEMPKDDFNILPNKENPTIEKVLPKKKVPLCSPAAKFLSESQKKILIPDLPESEEDDEEATSICGECGKLFKNEDEGNIHMRTVHREKIADRTNHSAGDHKCPECNYRTNFAVHFYQHCLDHHTPKELETIIFNEKPINTQIIFMLAEHNMALSEETKKLKKVLSVETNKLKKDLEYIKDALKPKAPSTKFNCQKCNKLSSSPTRIQQHIIEDHCCKYCEKTFSSKIEKMRHNKYMCKVCEKTFGHNLELHIHTKTYHKQDKKGTNSESKETILIKSEPNQCDLPFKCTECSYKQGNRNDLIKHIETVHSSILSPAKINKPVPVPAPRNLRFKCTECNQTENTEANIVRHIENIHANILSPHKVDDKRSPPTPKPEISIGNTPTHHKCNKCNYSATNAQNLSHHMKVQHSRYVNLPNWFLVGDSHLNTLNNREVEKATKGKLFCPGFARPKEGRAYCSTNDWPNARFPANSHSEIIPKILSERRYEGGIVLCPTNDISNIAMFPQVQQFTMAEKSAQNIVNIVEKALEGNKALMKTVLMEYPTRADSTMMNQVVLHANKALRGCVGKSRYRDQILIGNMGNLNFSNTKEMVDRFGPTNSSARYDGIHFRGNKGKSLYTESVVAAVRATSWMDKRKPEREASSSSYIPSFMSPRNPVRQGGAREAGATPVYNSFEVLSN